jgi:formate--tetrahydrofolate ligase
MRSSLEIAQGATLRPIADVAADAGIEADELEQYGRHKAKVDLSILERLAGRPDGKIVNVTRSPRRRRARARRRPRSR